VQLLNYKKNGDPFMNYLVSWGLTTCYADTQLMGFSQLAVNMGSNASGQAEWFHSSD
jgi:hypothetical protein